METLFKRVYINGEPERLPKEDGRYVCFDKDLKQVYEITYAGEADSVYKEVWLKVVDWYLSPVTREEIIEILNKNLGDVMNIEHLKVIIKSDFEKITNEMIGGNGK